MNEIKMMEQHAPYPQILADLVAKCTYRPGWTVELKDIQRDKDHGRGEARGLTLVITTLTTNSYEADRWCESCYSPVTRYRVYHYSVVPAATYNEQAWRRWLFDRFVDVEIHEACEFFRIDEDHPFSPVHAPGHNPYTITELATNESRRTSYLGELNPQ